MKKSEKLISRTKIVKSKQLFIDQLKSIPNIQIACEKLSIGRSTFYRWQSEDLDFKKDVEQSIFDGVLVVNDLAESKLVSSIKSGDMRAIEYWLKHHHVNYSTVIKLKHSIDDDELSDIQKQQLSEVLKVLNNDQ